MSYNMHKMLSSQFQIHSFKNVDFKITLWIILTLLAPRGEEKILNILLRMSYNMPKMFCSKFQSHIIKVQDFKINPINPFNPISTKGDLKF